MKEPNKKYIFFVSSHQNDLKAISYNLQKEHNKFKLCEELCEIKNSEENLKFKVKVFSISFDESNIINSDSELEIYLTYKSEEFKGKIKFNRNKNNFIYNFSFDILQKEKEDLNPPSSLNLSDNDKFCLFHDVLKTKYQNNESLLDSLLEDSLDLLKIDCDYYYIDFYLSLFCISYKNKKIKELLSLYDLEKIKLSENLDKEKIRTVFNEIRNNPEIIAKYFDENEQDIYIEIFYNLFLYYSMNYELKKVNELLNDKKSNKYYQKILYSLQVYFRRITLPNSFVDEMIRNGFEMNYDKFIITLNYLKSLENILAFLNRHTELINKILKNHKDEKDNEENEEEEENKKEKEFKKINLCQIITIQINGNINNISKEIDELLDKSYIFDYIEFGDEFWRTYSEIFNKKNLSALLIIKNILLNIKNKNKNLVKDIDFINKFIHDTGIEMSKKRKFRNNIEILDFIKYKDIYYSDKKFKKSRDTNIFIGLNLSMNRDEKNEFLKLWNSIDFNEIFDEEQYFEFQKIITSHISHISLFHLIFQFFGEFDEKNSKNYDNIILFRDKYNSLIKLLSKENINDLNDSFIEDSANLIYILEQNKSLGKSFIQNDLVKRLPIEINNKIFLKLLSKYEKLPDNIIEEIADFFTKGKEHLICENLINNFKNIANIKCKKQILNKINNSLIIDKNMLFYENEKNPIKAFINFKKIGIFNEPNYEHTQYVQAIKSISKEILDYIIDYNITENELNKIEKSDFFIFENKMRTLIELLDLDNKLSKENIDKIINVINDNKIKIKEQIKLLENYLMIDQEFYEVAKYKEISELEKLLDILKNESILEYEKSEYQKKFEEYKNKYPENYIADRTFLSASKVFKNIYKYLKKINQNSEESQNTFEEALKHYKSLKYLFEKIPHPNIQEDIFEVCLETIRTREFQAEKEISLIQNYLKINSENKDFSEIGNNLKICAKKNEISNIIKGIELFLKCKNASKTNFLVNLKLIKDNLRSKNFKANDINAYLKDLSKINFNIFNLNYDEEDNISEIFILISNNPEAFFFLMNLSEEDSRNFQEMIDISDNNFLTFSDIQDLDICRKFINDIGNNKNEEDKILIETFIRNGKNNKNNKNILLHFKSFFNNFYQFKELKFQKLDKIETNKSKSKKIAKNSFFKLRTNIEDEKEKSKYEREEENDYILFEGNYYINQTKKKISFNELQELREISMLNKNIQTKDEKKVFEYNKKFTENIKSIINLYYFLEEIAKNGYHEKLEIIVTIKNYEILYKINSFFSSSNYIECKNVLLRILEDMENAKINVYKNKEYELVRFIYGKQFSFVYNCLREKNYDKIDLFLNSFTNNLYKKKIKKFDIKEDLNTNEEEKLSNFKNVIINCNSFFKEVLNLNNITLKDIFKHNIILSEFKCSGLYVEFAINMGIEETILSYYYLLTKNYPIHQALLLCNKETSSDEIKSFIHLAILCPYNVLFMLGKIEELSSENCQTLINLISELTKIKGNKINSCLVFVYSKNNSEIARHLHKSHYKTFEEDKIKSKIKSLKENIFESKEIEIYHADRSGLGKSTKIKNDSEKLGKKYIYFPLGGEFNKKEVFSRLQKLKLSITKGIIFHLDLFDTEKTESLKEFLISLLITKVYKNKDDIFFFDKEIEIKIELPFGFVDFFSKFPILKMFKNKFLISYENLPPLIVSKKINSQIQILCNYLRVYKNKKLENSDLVIPGISPDYLKQNKNIIKAEIIPDNECKELINEFINIKFPNYYQIDSFIKIVSGQFMKFNRIKELSIFYLTKKAGNEGNKTKLLNERMNLIGLIIQSTQYFISSSYDKILNSQKISHNFNIGGEYDIDKQNQIAIEALSKSADIVSYNNITSPLIYLNEDINSYLSIISSNSSQIKNISYISKIKDKYNSLKDYQKFKPKDFYQELKAILNLENPIDKNSGNQNNLNTIKDIIGYYVITPDNFFKMLLILLKIRENVPVIMMGETGCGKTSLIRKLDELLNNGEDKMKILNIHSGITNEKIVEFLFSKQEYNKMSIIDEAKELEKLEQCTYEEMLKKGKYYEKRKLWIFLDEINTCNSLGLISELICKHSCNGIQLPENIVFIGACNPYRISKIDDFDGLKFKNEKNSMSNLVYTVNPLPHCLLNYIINFGSLPKEDELKYIENIIKEPIEKYYLDALEAENNTLISKVINTTSIFVNWILRKNKVIKRNFDIDDLKENKKEEYLNLFKTAKEAVIVAHNFIREKNDVSSVSLRELRRFSIFYIYFKNYLTIKKKSEEKNEMQIYLWIKNLFFDNLNDYNIYKYSIILSIFMCYYLRIRKKKEREEFVEKMNLIFRKNFTINFLDIPNREKEYIINNIKLPRGIAKNEALLNNLFVLFICITAKIPLFIVGKPGCSKSLSVELLFKSMKGEDSEFAIFKNLPKLYYNSYQGSLSSTSQGILKIFQKARRILEQLDDKQLEKVISMVFIDEMGLAEHSPNNPLKVLHSELEYDLNEGRNKVAFVGLSNWKLDASKMNRGIYQSIPEPDEEDLKKTSVTIAESYDKSLTNKNEDIFKDLAKTYHSYINDLKKNIDKADFHGARDFYNLIKIASKNLSNKYPNGFYDKIEFNVKQNVGVNSIERNLAGLEFDTKPETSLERVKVIFHEKYNTINISKQYDVIERIKENINDLNNRYLLLVTNSPISEYLIYSILSEVYQIKNKILDVGKKTNDKIIIKKEIISYVGSKFDDDENSEEYILKMLNKIQVQMEKNVVLILKDLESVYPSLYTLFNQNFTIIGDKNYARLSVGYSNNSFSLVNNEFKCIILVDAKQISKEEPPFLNRFEKHIIDFEYLLTNEQIDLSNKIMNLRKNLEILQLEMMDNKNLKYDMKKLFINFNKEEIQGIIYYLSKKKISNEDIEDFILQKISMVMPQDIILLINYSENNMYKNEYKKILKFYEETDHSNLINYLKKFEKNKTIIYTFSRILEPLLSKLDSKNENENYIQTNKFGKLKKSNIKILTMSSIDSENELENEFDNFFSSQEMLFIFKFSPEDCEKINHLKNYIEEKERNNNDYMNKAYIFIIYLKRVFNNEDAEFSKINEIKELTTFLNENYYQLFIDNLNGVNENIINLIGLKNQEKFGKEKFIVDIDSVVIKNIYSIFSFFSYTLKSQIKGRDIRQNNYKQNIVEYIEKSDYLKNKLKEIYKLNLAKNKENKENKDIDFVKDLFKKNNINQNSTDYITEITEYLVNNILEYVKQFIFKSEKRNILSSFLSYNSDEEKKILNNKFIKDSIDMSFEEINKEDNVKFINEIGYNSVEILLGIQIPGIKPIIENIILYINNREYDNSSLADDLLNNENDLRFFDDEEEDENIKKSIEKSIEKNIEKNQNKLYDYFKKKIPLFKKIIDDFDSNDCQKEEAIKFYNMLYDDYILIFLANNFDLTLAKEFNIELIENWKNLIKRLVRHRFGDFNKDIKIDELFKKISRDILYIESNKKYIILVLLIYKKLSFIQLLNGKINRIIEQKEIKYECGTRRSPIESKKVNECFFIFTESMIKIILMENNLYNKVGDNLLGFTNNIKEIYHYASQLNFELNLFSKELSNIKSFIDIEKALNEINEYKEDNIQKLIDIIIEKNKHNKINENLKENEILEIHDNIKNLFHFLEKLIGKHKNFAKIFNEILYGEYLRITDENFRKLILELIIDNEDIIKYSTKIFIIFFYNVTSNNDLDSLDQGDELINQVNMYFKVIENSLGKNDSTKIRLEQILLNLFESYFLVFFEEIPNLEDNKLQIYFKQYYDSKYKFSTKEELIMQDFSLKIFRNKILQLEKIFNQEILGKNDTESDKKINYPNIIKLYSIAYIKIYLYKTISFVFKKDIELNDDILLAIRGESINDFRKIIKIYILKLINNYLDNYHDLKNYHFKKHNINFIEDFKEQLFEENNEILNYYFVSSEQKKECYDEFIVELDKLIENNFSSETKFLLKYIEEENIDIFYSIIANKILSNIDLDTKLYLKFVPFYKNLFNNNENNASNNLKELLSLFIDENKFNITIRNKIKLQNEDNTSNSLDYNQYEIILNSMRFCIQTTYKANKNNFYFNLISKDFSNIINNYCIPGIDEPDDWIINNYYQLKKHLNTKSPDHGAYVCSCGFYYEIPPCGFPTESSECPKCKKLIGGLKKKPEEKGYHKMILREGHYRIFKNLEEKKDEFERFKDTNELIPNMLLSDYKNKKIEPILNKNNFGMPKIDKITFIQKNKKIRKLSQIGYRLLNFIFYSHLFFSDCLGYINDDFKEKNSFENMPYIYFLSTDWNLLKQALFEKGITVIQIFLNLIFDKFSELLKNCGEMKNVEQRNKFEENVEELLNKCYQEYQKYSENYLKINQKLHCIKPEAIKSIILELYNPEQYDEKKYPFLKYFTMTSYPTEETFRNELYKIKNYEDLYPLVSSYINPKNKEIELLKYLPKYNKFLNFMKDYYSYKISRKEAYSKKLKDEPIIKDKKNDLNNFFEVWDKIKEYVTQYQCHQMEVQYFLNENMPLINFLVDDGETEKGMYLAGGYEQFIKWQNGFIKPIINALEKNKEGILYYFNENLKHKIDVQNATDNEIIKKEFSDNSVYINFLHLINLHCYRNIFFKNNKINYSNYNNFIFDFETIEEELGKILLTGKRIFNDKIHFVTYTYEGFRGEKSSTLINFMSIYPPQKLNDNEKKILFKYIKEKSKYGDIDFTQIIFSIQQIIHYLTQEKIDPESKLNDISSSIPTYINISNECKNLFENLSDFGISKLFEIFSFLELFCFDSMIKNLKDDYKIKLNEIQKQKIEEYYKNGEQISIDKVNLASFCRKLISRYLISKRKDNDINDDNLLSLYLMKADLWDLDIIGNKDIFEMEINIITDYISDIKICQAFELCIYLDPNNTKLKEFKEMIEKEKENEGKKMLTPKIKVGAGGGRRKKKF